jgi:hypothetical protein
MLQLSRLHRLSLSGPGRSSAASPRYRSISTAPATPGVPPRVHQFSAEHYLGETNFIAERRCLGESAFWQPDGAKGHRLDSRQRESSINQVLTAESKLLRCPPVGENARTCALFSSSLQRARKSRTGWRMGQSGSNASLRSNSLINRQDTGNIFYFRLDRARRRNEKAKPCLEFFQQIPYSIQQAIISS